VQPMLATRAADPAALPTGPDWVYEVKWDGVRLLADTSGPRLRLLTRTGRDATVAYPELAALAQIQGAVLDGELVAMVDGVPSFAALAERMHVQDPARARALGARVPVTYMVFDLLRLYGVDLTHRSFDERRATLERLELGPPARLSPVYDDGGDLWQVTAEHGLEGVLAKRRSSTYQPGRRSRDWVKAAHRLTRAAAVGGWRAESTGSGRLGAVLLGATDGAGALRYLGRAGSGLTGPLGAALTRLLEPRARASSPFGEPVPAADVRGVHWCEPDLVLDVAYLTRTPAGRLRQPVVRGLRDDASPDPWEQP
jgi:bifunctional non-homologous end joining protein LigD